jgi:hypothetical protein
MQVLTVLPSRVRPNVATTTDALVRRNGTPAVSRSISIIAISPTWTVFQVM